MLTQLYIQNIAVIEKTDIAFGPGVNIFTGETGAGKSILIDAINAVLGSRTSRELVRTGAQKAQVTALFEELGADTFAKLEELGYEAEEDGILLISREISADGKNVCRLGGRPATVGVLREVASTLITIHGQHDNQALLSPDKHMGFIDAFAADGGLLEQYRALYAELSDTRRQLEQLNMDEAEKLSRIDLLQYQIDEISLAQLHLGEEEELLEQKKKVTNAAKILEQIAAAGAALDGGEDYTGILELYGTLRHAVQEAARYYPQLEGMSRRLEEQYYELEEFSSDLHSYEGEFDFDDYSIEQMEERLDLLYRLKRKYGGSEEEILAYCERAQQELENITHADRLAEQLTQRLEKLTGEARDLAEKLSAVRVRAAEEFTRRVGEELTFLDMPFVVLNVRHDIRDLGMDGMDEMEFLISTNPGEPPKPLAKVASGGELSRIMLSLKNVIADRDRIGTLIFDEVDAGVSGRAAQKIGMKLKEVSHGRQIICVTHLAQVACYADVHLLIEKQVRDGRTYTEVHALDAPGRISEIARIIGGENITPAVLSSAEELLAAADI